MSRDALIAAFLAQHGYREVRAEPLAQDASFRRYLRLLGGPRPAVLMDAPPPEDIRPFVHIAEHLAGIGLSVPEIIAADAEGGMLLEEDLGDDLFPAFIDSKLIKKLKGNGNNSPPPLVGGGGGEGLAPVSTPPPNPLPQGEGEIQTTLHQLFQTSVDVLVAMQRATPPPALPAWDATTMASTSLATLFDWWWPAVFNAPAPDAARQDFAIALETMLAPVATGPTCFVHRDFFAGNLLWLPKRAGVRRVGIIDFQGAAIGHPAYDLVSLLQDARRDIPSPIAEQTIAHYLAARPELNPEGFRAAYAACAAQRHLRVAGQWVRLAQRDRRPNYLVHGPRTWRLLDQAVRHPSAAPLAAALDRWIPPARRGNPPGLIA